MTTMRHTTLRGLASAAAFAGMLAFAPAAHAAEPVASDRMASWTGFHAGVYGAYVDGTSRQDNTAPATTGDYDIDGAEYGVFAGYRYQYENGLVAGVEASLGFADVEGETLNVCPVTCYSEMDAVGAVNLQFGYALDRFLPYLSAGVSIADVEAGTRTPITPGVPLGDDRLLTGFSIGAGLEAKIADGWHLRGEYLYTDYEDGVDYFIPSQGQNGNVPFEDINSFRIGLSYHFMTGTM